MVINQRSRFERDEVAIFRKFGAARSIFLAKGKCSLRNGCFSPGNSGVQAVFEGGEFLEFYLSVEEMPPRIWIREAEGSKKKACQLERADTPFCIWRPQPDLEPVLPRERPVSWGPD